MVTVGIEMVQTLKLVAFSFADSGFLGEKEND
jgi:hypothetical protein